MAHSLAGGARARRRVRLGEAELLEALRERRDVEAVQVDHILKPQL